MSLFYLLNREVYLFVICWCLSALAFAGGVSPTWRGLHVDVSRHYFEPAVLRKFMDRMAGLNYNRLHLHLTDGPGWRLEIGRHFHECYGGFYTQEDMRQLIALHLQ